MLKVFLYGIGYGMQYVKRQLQESVEIIGYVDSFADIDYFEGRKVFKLEEVKGLVFNYIIVTIINRKEAIDIAYGISNMLGIDYRYIIPYFACCNTEKYIHKLKLNRAKYVEGIILGNSYARNGYLEEEFSFETWNLSTACQDIYYNYLTIKKCLPYLTSLKYVVIDWS